MLLFFCAHKKNSWCFVFCTGSNMTAGPKSKRRPRWGADVVALSCWVKKRLEVILIKNYAWKTLKCSRDIWWLACISSCCMDKAGRGNNDGWYLHTKFPVISSPPSGCGMYVMNAVSKCNASQLSEARDNEYLWLLQGQSTGSKSCLCTSSKSQMLVGLSVLFWFFGQHEGI